MEQALPFRTAEQRLKFCSKLEQDGIDPDSFHSISQDTLEKLLIKQNAVLTSRMSQTPSPSRSASRSSAGSRPPARPARRSPPPLALARDTRAMYTWSPDKMYPMRNFKLKEDNAAPRHMRRASIAQADACGESSKTSCGTSRVRPTASLRTLRNSCATLQAGRLADRQAPSGAPP